MKIYFLFYLDAVRRQRAASRLTFTCRQQSVEQLFYATEMDCVQAWAQLKLVISLMYRGHFQWSCKREKRCWFALWLLWHTVLLSCYRGLCNSEESSLKIMESNLQAPIFVNFSSGRRLWHLCLLALIDFCSVFHLGCSFYGQGRSLNRAYWNAVYNIIDSPLDFFSNYMRCIIRKFFAPKYYLAVGAELFIGTFADIVC